MILVTLFVLTNCQLFESVCKMYPDYKSKLLVIQGDLNEAIMGISNHDMKLIISNVNVVIHSAATVRFDEPLK